MVTEMELFESQDLTPLSFCLWNWVKSEVRKRKVDTLEELLARILVGAAHTKKREDQLRRTTRVAKCIEVDCGI
jgi:hypothetical protein